MSQLSSGHVIKQLEFLSSIPLTVGSIGIAKQDRNKLSSLALYKVEVSKTDKLTASMASYQDKRIYTKQQK